MVQLFVCNLKLRDLFTRERALVDELLPRADVDKLLLYGHHLTESSWLIGVSVCLEIAIRKGVQDLWLRAIAEDYLVDWAGPIDLAALQCVATAPRSVATNPVGRLLAAKRPSLGSACQLKLALVILVYLDNVQVNPIGEERRSRDHTAMFPSVWSLSAEIDV